MPGCSYASDHMTEPCRSLWMLQSAWHTVHKLLMECMCAWCWQTEFGTALFLVLMQTITHLLCRCVLSVYMYVSHWWALIGTTFFTVTADAQCGGTPPCSSSPEEHHWYHRNTQPMHSSAPALLQTERADGTAPILLCSEDARATGTYLPPKSQRVCSYTSPSSHPTSIERKDLVSYSQNIGQE